MWVTFVEYIPDDICRMWRGVAAPQVTDRPPTDHDQAPCRLREAGDRREVGRMRRGTGEMDTIRLKLELLRYFIKL